MSSLSRIRSARRLSTSSVISISAAKSRLRSEHDPDKALAIYSSVSDHNRSPVSTRYAQDLTVKRLTKSRRFADIETLIESHKKDPKITQEPFLSTLIRSYGRAGMFDHAFRTFNQMDELGTPRSAISFNALLSACNQSKKFDQAIDLKPFGGLHIMYRSRSAARLAMGNNSRALEDAKEALTIAPQYPQAYICQGDAFMAMEEFHEAKKSYSIALQIDPSVRRSKSFKARIAKLQEKLTAANMPA